jgi:protocatechuate 3,4-dioxygenase beta subunit
MHILPFSLVDRRSLSEAGAKGNHMLLTALAGSLLAVLAACEAALLADESPPMAAPPKPVAANERRDAPDDKADAAGASSLRGIVRDASGGLAANSTVWLVVHRDDAFEPPLKTNADQRASFSFENLDEAKLFARGSRVTVVARDDAGRIGWRNYTGSERPQPLCEIRLREVTLITGRVFDPEGRPLVGARLTPKSFWIDRSAETDDSGERAFSLWPELAAEYAAVTRDDGVFEASGIPRGVQVRCELAAEGLEKVQTVIESGIAATVRLGKPGSIAGQLAVPAGAELPLAGFQLQARLQVDPKRPQEPAVMFEKAATVDEQGRFQFSDLPAGHYVIQPVASQNVPFVVPPSPVVELKPGQQLDTISLPLILCREVRGRVVERGTSRGIEAVEIVVSSGKARAERHSQSVTTDAEGRFSAWLPPGTINLYVRQVPVDYLPPPYEESQRDFDTAPRVELEPATAIEGIVLDERGNSVPAAWLDIQRISGVARLGSVRQNQPERADASGRFKVRQLAPAEQLVLRARSASAASIEPMTIVPSEVHGPVELVISENHACWFRGRVVDRRGNPLPGARVALAASRQIPEKLPDGNVQYYRQVNYLVAVPAVAGDGSFETEALYVGDNYYLQITSPDYADRVSEQVKGEPGRVHDFGTVVLQEFATLTGRVVDAFGNAVPNAELHVMLPDGSPRLGGGFIEVRSDQQGHFELPAANRTGVVRIWARAGDMTTDGAESFFPDLVDGPLTIEVAPNHAFRIAGKVVDTQGRPVRASVTINWQWQRKTAPRNYVNRNVFPGRRRSFSLGGTASLDGGQVREDGSLLTVGLWPGEHYHLALAAEGYATLESDVSASAAGSTFDVGRLVLRRTNLTVEGEVLDADGKPVEKASVFNSGDAQEPVTVETDTAGRFRVEGLSEGPVYLLIRKLGYWPAGLRCAAGDVGQRVSLVDGKNERPKKPLPPSLDRGPSPERRELARRLLSELWPLRSSPAERRLLLARGRRAAPNDLHGQDIVRRMAGLDYAQALKWSAEEGGGFDELVRVVAFEQIVHDNIDLAMAHAQAPGGSQALKRMASRRIIDGAHDDAVRLLEAALHGNLTTEYPWRNDQHDVISQAEIGRLAIAAGRVEWGRQLINDAADRVERLAGDAQAETRESVAAALASFDSARSVRVWEMPPPNGGVSNNMHEDLAVSIGVYDLEAARHIAAQASNANVRGFARAPRALARQSNDFDAVLVRIAYRLARKQPERALVMFKEIPDKHRLERAEALGRVAMTLAPRNPQTAYRLFEEALDLCSGVPPTSLGFFQADRAETAARIAVLAAEAGYPDLQTLVDRALAVRFAPSEARVPAARSESIIKMAWVLALIDPRLARDLLQGAAPPEAAVDGFRDGEKLGKWLQAWTMADLDQALALFHKVLADQGPDVTADCISYGLLPMIDALLWSREGGPFSMLPQDSASWLEPVGADN